MNQPHIVHLPPGNPAPPPNYQVPPGTAQEAAQEAAQPTMTDQLQQDAETPEALPEWPEDAPEFRPLMRLPFGQRADAMELMGELQTVSGSMTFEKGQDVTPQQAAIMYRAFEKIDQLLCTVAVRRADYEAWPGRYDDALFSQLWSAYQARMNPGEA